MKIRLTKRESGSALVVTLVIAVCIGIALAAYLNLIKSQTNFAVRAQTWNSCMTLVEAGIEEAMAHLNNPANTNIVLGTEGWTWSGTGFTKSRTFGDDSFVALIVTNAASAPTITCTGYVVAPVTVATSKGFIAVAGPTPGVQYISRAVRVTTRRDPQFSKALTVKEALDFKGNNVLVDSYNSKVGPYNALLAGDKGDVGINKDIANVGNIGNADIKGHLSVGPHASVQIGPNGTVGSVSWHLAGKTGIESGWLRKDMNLQLPDVQPPWSGGAFTFLPSDKGNSWDYVVQDGNFEIAGDFTLGAAERMFVKGEASLWVKGNLILSGFVKMQPDAYLRIYVSKNVTVNATWDKAVDPIDLLIFGLPTSKIIDISTGARFPAVLYAPQGDVTMSGQANFFGSMVANKIIMSGNSAFHYDEALMLLKSFRGFVITSWQEL